MGRFFFIISAVLHGILLLLLFSWQISVADRVHLKNILEVSLVEKIEEMKPRMGLPRVMNKPEKMKSPEKKEIFPAPGREEVKKEEKKEERIEPASAVLKEERRKDDHPVPLENKDLKAQVEQPLKAETEINPPRPEMGNYEGRELGSEGNGGAGVKEGTASTFLASAASGTGTDGIGLGGTGETPGRMRGTGSPGQTASIRYSPGGESDGVLSLILRKLEAAKRYPKTARRMRIEGTAVVRFKLDSGGRVEAVEIVDSSGSEILDKASLETVHAAAPFPYKEGWLKVGIVFKLF